MTKEEQIEHIMLHFEWRRVARAMKALNWTWGTDQACPTVERMQAHARSLLTDVCKPGVTDCGSGGFTASRDGKMLRLAFCVAHMDGDDL